MTGETAARRASSSEAFRFRVKPGAAAFVALNRLEPNVLRVAPACGLTGLARLPPLEYRSEPPAVAGGSD